MRSVAGRCPVALFSVALLLIAAQAAMAFESPYRSGPEAYPRFQAKQAEPGIVLGAAAGFPLPKTLLYSVGVDELIADADTWVAHGYGGFFLTGVAGEWSADIWAADAAPWTIGASDATFQKVQQAAETCRALGADLFLSTAFSHPFEWFNDTAWQHIAHSFRQMAIFARDTGCTGLAIDIEYINQQYHFSWEGYSFDGYSRGGLVNEIRKRATAIAAALYDEFPGMVLLTLPEGMFTLGSHLQTAWIEEAARRNAPGGVHICTEYTYRRPNPRFMLGHAWMTNHVLGSMLSARAERYWRTHGSVAEGLWPFGDDPDDYHGAAPSANEFRQAVAASLMAGRRYNWIYSHNLKPWLLGRDAEKYSGADPLEDYAKAVSERMIVTNPGFRRAAEAIRAARPADLRDMLGLTIVPTLAGPREELEIGLMPNAVYDANPIAALNKPLWDLGLRLFRGEELDLHASLGTQAAWKVIGPFPNAGGSGLDMAYPPESDDNLNLRCETPLGTASWQSIEAPPRAASINLARMLQPFEEVCAYALCWVESAREQAAQLRLGANDTCKLWMDGTLVFECRDPGRAILDREIIPVTLKAGRSAILLKVCNNKKDWGFIFRITDPAGRPLRNLRFIVP